MKKVLAVTAMLLVLTFALAAAASAQYPMQPNWRFYLKADDGAGYNAMAAATIGVMSSSTDGFGVDGTASDAQDSVAYTQTTKNTRCVFAVFDNKVYIKDVKSPRLPSDAAYAAGMGAPNGNTFGDYPYEPYQKIWDLRVFCLPTSTTDQTDTIRLNFQVVHTGYLPPAMIGGKTAKYTMRMVDNKSFAGAPANGTTWDIPVPASNLAVMTTWHTISLPQLVISAANVDAAMSEGYQMQFIQTVVPEPSSLMVLAGGLMGLAGYGIRRRRS